MRMYKRFVSMLALILLVTSSGRAAARAVINEGESVSLQGVGERPDVPNRPALVNQAPGPIVADHTVVDLYDDIPQEWIDEVKKMWITVPGESHSSGYRMGCDLLESLDSRFQVNVQESGTPEGYTDQYLRVSRASWGDVSHTTGWRYGYGEEDWYTSAQAVSQTKTLLTYANTNGFEIAALGFGWCWDTTWHNSPGGGIDPVYQVRWAGSSVGGPDGDLRWGLDVDDQPLTGNSVSMDTYINATEEYIALCESNGYPTVVFFTTGPVDGGGNTSESGYQRYLKHEHIRAHVEANNRVLFDYADILNWGNDGTQHTVTWTDHGGQEQTFPNIHPDNMLDLDGTYAEDGDHIGQRGAVRLAKALWWMLARLAGWDGVVGSSRMELAKATSTDVTSQGETLTYTVTVRGTNMPPTATVTLTDTVPTGLSYVPGSLTATGGSWDDESAPTLQWTGVLTPTPTVTLTYAVTVTATAPQFITNTVVAAAPGHEMISATATISVTRPSGYPDLTPSYKVASAPYADHGERVTYTVGIRNATGPLSVTVLFTDTLHDGLAYVPGSLAATSGTWDDSLLPTLTWTGVLTPSPAITITYAAVVTYVVPGSTAILPATITNTAIIAAPGYQTVTRTVMVQINPHLVYLPLVLRQD